MGGGPRTARAQCDATLEGKVIDVQSFQPLSGARVAAPEQVRVGRTGVDGTYRIEGLCPGELYVEVAKARFQTHRERFTLRRGANRHDFYLLSGDVDSVTAEADRLDGADRTAQASVGLEGRELAQTRGRDLARSLGDLPGVRVLGSGATAKPVVNGLSANRLLLVVDGVPLESQDWGLDHAPEIDPFLAEEIRVLKGAAGVRYGLEALGGVIVLEPRAYPERSGLRGDLNVIGMTNGWGGAASGAVLGTLPGAWDALSLKAEATYQRTGDLTTPSYVLNNTAREERALRTGARFRWDGGEVEASASHYFTRYGIFSGTVATSPTDFRQQLETRVPSGLESFSFGYDIARPFSDVEHNSAQARSRLRLSKDTDLELTYAYQFDNRREFDFASTQRDRDRPQALFRLQTHALDARVETRAGDIELEYGVTADFQENDFQGRPFLPDYTRLGAAGFFIGRYLVSRWELELGLRAEYEYYDTIRPGPTNVSPDIRRELEFFAFTATGGVIYELGEGWTLRGQLATAARNPSPDELFADGPAVGVAAVIEGDPDLETETTFNAQATLAYDTERVSVSLEGYSHYITDYIFLAPKLGGDGELDVELTIRGAFPAFAFRQVDAGFAGFDGRVSVDLVPWLELQSVLSVVRARDLTNDRFLVFVPPDRLRNRLTLQPRRWGPLRRPYGYVESEVTLQQTRFEIEADFSEPPPSYHLVNVGAGLSFRAGSQPVFVDLEIRNLTNETHRDYLSRLRYFADEPGISGFLRISMPFETSWTGSKPKEERHDEME